MMLWSMCVAYMFKVYSPWINIAPVIGTLHAPEKDAVVVERGKREN